MLLKLLVCVLQAGHGFLYVYLLVVTPIYVQEPPHVSMPSESYRWFLFSSQMSILVFFAEIPPITFAIAMQN